MKHAELFAGYGGLSLAVETIFGADLVWHSEFDAAPSRVMARHWPDAPNYGDATSIDWSTVEPVDIISGGSPCPDISTAGRRAGMNEGTRSNLWVAMRDAIATIQPTFVVWENVRGAHSATAYSEVESEQRLLGDTRDTYLRATGRVLGDLAQIGYDAEWRTISASSIGAPHGRERVFILAWRRGTTAENSLSGRSRGGYGPSGSREGARQADQTRGSARASGLTGSAAEVKLLPTVMSRDYDGNATASNLRRVTTPLKAIEALLPTVTTSDANGVGAHGDGGADLRTAVAEARFDIDASAMRRWEQTLFRSTPPPPLPLGAWYFDTPTASGEIPNSKSNATRAQIGDPKPAGIGPQVVGIEESRQIRIEDKEGTSKRLIRAADHLEFGQYESVVRRWETVLQRPAPPPTELSPKGRHRLSQHFTEWMMGLPEGWICDTPGVSRNEAIKMAGNGVVPQQAAAALDDMIQRIPAEGVSE